MDSHTQNLMCRNQSFLSNIRLYINLHIKAYEIAWTPVHYIVMVGNKAQIILTITVVKSSKATFNLRSQSLIIMSDSDIISCCNRIRT